MGQCCTLLNKTREIPEGLNPASIPKFIPAPARGRVIKCYDGDTITIAAYLPYKESELYKFSVRIRGVDCPELRSRTPSEKTCAKIAKRAVERKLLNTIVQLHNIHTDKYGRILADVELEGCSIGSWLLDQCLAVPYTGKTKAPPVDWMKYYQGE